MDDKLTQLINDASQVFILTDENVARLWLPVLHCFLPCDSATDIVIKAGEKQKNLMNVKRVWNALMKHKVDRSALLINFGGGMITDLGGFAASTYKRGIKFVNIPTTLLGMVDAAIGGKTSINYEGVKNPIGTFAEAEEVLVMTDFLTTLPKREILSGMAEMVKCGFIFDAGLLEVNLDNYKDYVLRAGQIKREIAEKDLVENDIRKVLNFGHTLGHAIESHCYNKNKPLLHGEAVAVGMTASLWLSARLLGLNERILQYYEEQLRMLLSETKVSLSEADIASVMRYLPHDKKAQRGEVQYVLLYGIGEPVWGIGIEKKIVKEALKYTFDVVGKVSAK